MVKIRKKNRVFLSFFFIFVCILFPPSSAKMLQDFTTSYDITFIQIYFPFLSVFLTHFLFFHSFTASLTFSICLFFTPLCQPHLTDPVWLSIGYCSRLAFFPKFFVFPFFFVCVVVFLPIILLIPLSRFSHSFFLSFNRKILSFHLLAFVFIIHY